MTSILAPEVYPFTVAAGVMLGLVAVEGLGLLLGASVFGLVDHALDLDHAPDVDAGDVGAGQGLLNWFNLGGIPFLALVILASAAFSVSGYVVQAVSTAVAGPLPASVAALAAIGFAIPATRYGSRVIAKVVPRDETYAVGLSDLVGRTGKVMVGPLDQGLPGSVSTTDAHGNRHTLRARAAPGADPIEPGAQVLLVEREGQVFTAVPAPPELIP